MNRLQLPQNKFARIAITFTFLGIWYELTESLYWELGDITKLLHPFFQWTSLTNELGLEAFWLK